MEIIITLSVVALIVYKAVKKGIVNGAKYAINR